ncbi:uncharacterized protein [Miscanthus floridulus]|uniref:uncharacterized protein n=1 Tax=Miscanthus floridulus TaxID=154761 RepID=UPI00345AC7C2
MAAARRIQSTALAASTAVSWRIQTTVFGASIAAGSHPLMSQDLFRRLRHQEIRTVFGLLRQTYFCLQQRHVCASSSSNKDITASASESELIKAQKGSSIEALSLGCVIKKGPQLRRPAGSHPLISQNLLWSCLARSCRWKDNCSCFRWKNNCNCFRGNKRPEGILEGSC